MTKRSKIYWRMLFQLAFPPGGNGRGQWGVVEDLIVGAVAAAFKCTDDEVHADLDKIEIIARGATDTIEGALKQFGIDVS